MFRQILLLVLSALTCKILVPLALLLSLPTVVATSNMQSFPDITFKVFSNFVAQNFSSWVSLAKVLLVLFSLIENPDLLNLHGRQKIHMFKVKERKIFLVG